MLNEFFAALTTFLSYNKNNYDLAVYLTISYSKVRLYTANIG